MGGSPNTGPQAGSTSTPPTTVNGETVTFAPAAGSFKLLTSTELQNSLNALLGPVTLGDVMPDTFVGGFAKVGGSTVAVSTNGVNQYRTAIEAATASVFADDARRSQLVGCVPNGVDDTACFRSFIERFGRLAWRRELTSEELERQTTLASQLAAIFENPIDGLRATTNAILLSPNFLYRLERGEQDSASGSWRYTGYEMASRLAYFLTNSTPDDALLRAAEQGTLATPEGIRSEAERLLEGNAAPGRESVRSFATELFLRLAPKILRLPPTRPS